LDGTKSYEETNQYIAAKIAYMKQFFPLGRRAIVLKGSGKVIGYCGLEPILIEGRSIVELSYGLSYEYWGKGYAFEAA
jgi:RimJ/RimL family protein N-acetyltransferase